MNEVTTVNSLIFRLIAIAIALGAAGTLFDSIRTTGDQAKTAVTSRGISYVEWNKKLISQPSAK